MRILAVGDVIGRSGRRAFCSYTPKLKVEKKIDVVVVNGENAAHGKGLSHNTFMELLSGGADIITSGNHIWDNKDIFSIIDQEPFLIRPANYPEGTPGKGFCIYPHRSKTIGILNLLGRSFMPVAMDCPFNKATEIIKELQRECDIILLDFHAETTSEKVSMGFFLDGKVTAIWGTHTHVQTVDSRILPQGTAYITDLGMVGALNSVLGIRPEEAIKKFLTAMPVKFEVADGPCIYCGIIFEIDDKTNKIVSMERIYQTV